MKRYKVDMFFSDERRRRLKPEHIEVLREKMLAADDWKFDELQYVKLKEPVTMLLISIIFGNLGIDAFIMGKFFRGLIKFATGGLFGILYIIDIIRIKNEVREANYRSLLELL